MTILVTGGTGFLGSHVAEQLSRTGATGAGARAQEQRHELPAYPPGRRARGGRRRRPRERVRRSQGRHGHRARGGAGQGENPRGLQPREPRRHREPARGRAREPGHVEAVRAGLQPGRGAAERRERQPHPRGRRAAPRHELRPQQARRGARCPRQEERAPDHDPAPAGHLRPARPRNLRLLQIDQARPVAAARLDPGTA